MWVVKGVPSPFVAGILLSRKPPETQGKRIRFLERTMVEKNGEDTTYSFLLLVFFVFLCLRAAQTNGKKDHSTANI